MAKFVGSPDDTGAKGGGSRHGVEGATANLPLATLSAGTYRYLSGGGTLSQSYPETTRLVLSDGAFTLAPSYGYAEACVALENSSLTISAGAGVDTPLYFGSPNNYSAIVAETAGVTLVNFGVVEAFTTPGFGPGNHYQGEIGVDLTSQDTLTNTGAISGSGATVYYYKEFSYTEHNSAAGVSARGSEILNTGVISGGSGEAGAFGSVGLTAYGGYLLNDGSIEGGSVFGRFLTGSGGSGGAGASLYKIDCVNAGLIEGGAGKSGYYEGGAGGNGVNIASGSTLTNSGSIVAGSSGEGRYYDPVGGIGVYVGGGSELINVGFVAGGATAGSRYYSPIGAAGVSIDGGTLVNSGTVTGGANSYARGAGAAVAFGESGGTLIIDPEAVFVGQVAANSGALDLLELGGSGPGAFSGLGLQFTGFSSLDILAGSTWTIDTKAAYFDQTQVLGTTLQDSLILNGGGTLTKPFANFGSIQLDGGSFALSGSLASQQVNGVLLNSSTLSVFAGASILTNPGLTAVEAGAAGDSLINQGTLTGGAGEGGGAGGAATNFGAAAGLTNYGLLAGGTGSAGSVSSGAGGTGVVASGALLNNRGRIAGGAGGSGSSEPGGAGGAGVYLSTGTLTNSGTISGGAGGHTPTQGSVGGAGLLVKDGFAFNQGSILGGAGGLGNEAAGGAGGEGVYLNAGTLTNVGTIIGGMGGGGAPAGAQGDSIQFGAAAATLIIQAGAVFSGAVVGNAAAVDTVQLDGVSGVLNGLGSQFTGLSAVNVYAGASWTLGSPGNFEGTLTIDGVLTVTGGISVAPTVMGSIAATVAAAAATLINEGTLTGGAESGKLHGGQGVLLNAGTVINSGVIAGGTGGAQGRGGVGASIAAGATLQNSGKIVGATGGLGGAGANVYGGLFNTGQIIAGAGSLGDGVFITGGTVTSAGTISGATGADAVLFGKAAGTLIIDPGAVFDGVVAANAAYVDLLVLGGTQAATLSGLGTQFSGFQDLSESAGATWTLAAGDSFTGAATIAGTMTLAAGATLGTTTVQSGPANLVVDAGADVAAAVTAALSDTLTLAGASAGTLSGFGSAITGFGTVALMQGATWTIDSTVAAAEVVQFVGLSAQDTLSLSGGGTLTHALAGLVDLTLIGGGFDFASTYGKTGALVGIDNANLMVSAGDTITGGMVLNGGTLTNAGAISALNFGTVAGTLTIDPGAGFSGMVSANIDFDDVVQLAGSSASTFDGLGSQFTGFTSATVMSGANWSLGGTSTFTGLVDVNGALAVGAGMHLFGGTEQTAVAVIGTGASLQNSGILTGGAASGVQVAGAGVFVALGAGFQNMGTVSGGTGSAGGTGVVLDGVATNSGFISGGAGNGTGVLLTGGSLTNAGTIKANGTGDAVLFGPAAATLTLDPGQVTSGAVVASASYADLLVLAGTGSGTLTGLGSQFIGFTDLSVAAGANWTLSGTQSFQGKTTVGGVLTVGAGVSLGSVNFTAAPAMLAIVSGALFDSSVAATVGASDTLSLGGTATGTLAGFGTQFTGFSTLLFQAGANWAVDSSAATISHTMISGQSFSDTLELSAGGSLTTAESGFGVLQLDGKQGFQLKATTGFSVGTVLIDTSATLQGSGSLSAAVTNVGELSVSQGSVLTVAGALSSTGTLASAGTLSLANGFTLGGNLRGAGEVILTGNGSFSSGVKIATQLVEEKGNLAVGGSLTLTSQLHDYDLITSSKSQVITISGMSGKLLTSDGTLAASGLGTSQITMAFTNNGVASVTSGTFDLTGTVTNNSTMSALGGVLMVNTDVEGAGNLDISNASTISLEDGASATETTNFLASTGLLGLANPLSLVGEIAGFGGSDQIDLVDTAATKLSFANGILTVTNGTTTVASLHFTGQYSMADFSLSSDHNGGSLITHH